KPDSENEVRCFKVIDSRFSIFCMHLHIFLNNHKSNASPKYQEKSHYNPSFHFQLDDMGMIVCLANTPIVLPISPILLSRRFSWHLSMTNRISLLMILQSLLLLNFSIFLLLHFSYPDIDRFSPIASCFLF